MSSENKGRIFGYARVSSTEQNLDRQLKALSDYVEEGNIVTDEQLESFQSQKQYYQEKISENRDWVMVGIYADEAITGTKVDKREQFQRMIQDCIWMERLM